MSTHTPRDELARSFSPLVAVVASQDAEEICQKNHIPSFADFLKPFGNLIEGRGTCLSFKRAFYHHAHTLV